MSEIKFSDGIVCEKEDYNRIIYPEELLDKRCSGCVRCEERDHGKEGYHCCMQDYNIDIQPEDKACVHFWDKEYHERCERSYTEAEEKRRKELWAIYEKKDPVKLLIVFDGYGKIPECPVCGEMPYSTKQCHWCGQRFIQDEDIQEYTKPKTIQMNCMKCGAEVTVHISKYNGHKQYHCNSCGCSFME